MSIIFFPVLCVLFGIECLAVIARFCIFWQGSSIDANKNAGLLVFHAILCAFFLGLIQYICTP